jgi:hypothetical protein
MWQQADDITTSTWTDAESYCTLVLVDTTASSSKKEPRLLLIMGNNPAVNTSVFKNTFAYPHWTSTLYTADGVSQWQINLLDGASGFYDISIPHYAKCVRRNLPFNTLKDNGDSTVTDADLGLMWQQGGGGSMYWADALNYCEGLTLAGHVDWRLPNIRELVSLTDDRKANPSIDRVLFEGTGFLYNYWSSTPSAGNTDNRWVVSFKHSSTTTQIKTNKQNYVRCVRGQKSDLLDYREISIDPPALDFGYIGIGDSQSKELVVTNIGKDILIIGSLAAPSAPFSVIYDGCSGKSLSAWQSCTVTIAFSSSAKGVFTDTIIIPSNDADHPNVKVDLWATVTAAPGGRYLLPDTGQTVCFSAQGYSSSCPLPGSSLAQDGSYTINPMSFTNNGDGTVTDNNTLLIWQRDDDNPKSMWNDAAVYCENLYLGGHTGWRLPTWRNI